MQMDGHIHVNDMFKIFIFREKESNIINFLDKSNQNSIKLCFYTSFQHNF